MSTTNDRESLAEKKRRLLEMMLAERQAKKQQQAAEEEALPKADRSQPLPLSYVQQRLWFLSQLDPDSPAYNIPAGIYLEGPLDRELLERALNVVVERHEDLRTNFHRNTDGESYAVIADERRLELELVDYSSFPLEEAEEKAQQLVPEVSMVPFDITKDPLLQLRLVRLAPEAHVLLLVIHHIISDVWSIGVFFAELGGAYDLLVAGREPELPELPLQYADYVAWQRQKLDATGELDRQLEYWVEQLSGVEPVIDLPTDFPRPKTMGSRGKRYAMHLGDNVHTRLLSLAKEQEASLYMAALTVFFMLLHRYTAQGEILVGTPMANRNRVEFEKLIGFFVNTVVLRGDVSTDPGFRDLLKQVRKTTLEAFSHHDLPFDRVVNALGLERDLSRNPLYQVDFAFQNLPSVDVSTPGLSLKPFTLRETTSRFDLELDLKEASDGFEGFIRYNAGLFTQTTIERMARHYHTLLEAVIAEPDRPLSSLPLLNDGERAQLVAVQPVQGLDFVDGQSAETLDGDPLAHRLIEARAAATPDAPAAFVGVEGGETWTFGELDRRANVLAHHLVDLGVGPETLVALAMPRSLDLLAALLAVWKAGGAYLPVDPCHPEARLRDVLGDSGARHVLTTGALAEKVPVLAEADRTVVAVDSAAVDSVAADSAAVDDTRGQSAPSVDLSGAHAAYVLYTSGSTGKPKGVVVPHAALVDYLLWCQRAYGLGASDDDRPGSVVHSPLGFDLTVTGLLAPLAAGRSVGLVPEVSAVDGAGEGPGNPLEILANTLRQTPRARVLKITPAHLEALGQLLTPAELAEVADTLVIGGEALHWDTLTPWFQHAPRSVMVNEYGPTETVVGCTVRAVRSGDTAGDLDGGVVPIGQAVDHASALVVDRHLRLTPPGVPGELVVGGIGVTRGYLGRPALTAERFVPDPFGDQPGARLYRTGDRVRRLPGEAADELLFLGRLDHQVKVRGYRIEPGEIESALATHADVQAATVVARDDGPGGATALVAYVVIPGTDKAAQGTVGEAVRTHAAQSLPDYMVPAFVVVLDALPLTRNGKVDRRALPVPGAWSDAKAQAFVAPRTPVEAQIAKIWGEVLKTDRIGVTDRFFDLGGQSMLAVQVISRLRDRLQVDVPVQSLFDETTVESLAAQVEGLREEGALSDLPAITPAPRDQPLPLSFSQERLWFIDRLLPGLSAYNIPGAVHMQGELDADALEAALNEIVRRHEVLRTTFTVVDGQAVQVIADSAHWPIPRHDLTHLPADERRGVALERAREAAGEAFDLGEGPLMRPQLLKLSDDEHLFVLIIHQIVYDMWSRDIFLAELVAFYEAFRTGAEMPMAEPTLQYADYAWWQRERLSESVLDEQLDYWRGQLAGLEVMELLGDRPRPAVQTMVGTRVTRRLSPKLTKGLKRLARRQKVTLFVTLLSGFNALLHRYTGHGDISLGSPVANRNRVETEGMMGFFANTVVLRTAGLGLQTPMVEVLQQVKAMTLDAFANQDIPFERLVNTLDPQRDLSRQPFFQVLFNFLINYQPPTMQLPELTLTAEEVHTGGVPFDFMMAMYEAEGSLHAVCDYSTDLYDASTVDRILDHFENLLESLAKNPKRRLGELAMLADGERQQLLALGRGAQRTDFDMSQSADVQPMHRVFESWVERTPDAVAAVCGDERLTYAELHGRAQRLAGHLRAAGVDVDDPVAIVDERGLDFLSAILGVFMAGGAYLPLNPLHPDARLVDVIGRAGASVVLTGTDFTDGLTAALDETTPAQGEAATVLSLSDALGRDSDGGHGVDVDPGPSFLAYLIFTSGSTGQPKGVMVPHAGMVNHLWVNIEQVALEASDRLAQTAAQTFDISVWQFLAPLMVGGQVWIYPDAVAQNPQELFPALVRDGITGIEPVPALMRALLDAPEDARPDTFPDLRWIMPTGEALTPQLASEWLERYPGIPLLNAYGPAECSDDVSFFTVETPPDPEVVPRMPVGKAVANLDLWVVDTNLEPVPVGVPGELLIGGVGVARGYMGDPRRTAEAFVPDPLGDAAGARLYRSGDRLRLLPGGDLEFLGRVDHQVKIRGYRIEPGEVEATLVDQDGVGQAVVICREDTPGDRRLVAYTVPEEGATVDFAEVRRALRATLPDYMVPAAFVGLDAIPLTPHGKVDRKALPAPSGDRPELEAEYVAPRNELEETLAGIWRDILGLERVGVKDDFFDLGGHSLLLTQVVARVRDAVGVEVPLRQFFDRSTLGELAEVIENVRWLSESENLVGTAIGDDEEEGEL